MKIKYPAVCKVEVCHKIFVITPATTLKFLRIYFMERIPVIDFHFTCVGFNIIIRISTNFLMLSVKEHLHSELDGQSVFHNFGTEATQI